MIPPSSRTWSRELVQCVATAQCCPRGSRTISRNSAIARGLRETSAAERRLPGYAMRPLFRKELKEYNWKRDKEYKAKNHAQHERRMAARMDIAKRNAAEFAKGRETNSYKRKKVDVANDNEMDIEDAMRLEEQQVRGTLGRQDIDTPAGRQDIGPIPIPYTTAASKFIYGVSAVRAALLAGRRKYYKLYIHERAIRRAWPPAAKAGRDRTRYAVDLNAEKALVNLASNIPGLDVKMVADSFLPVMDRMSDDRPHNGVILEASPLPVFPVVSLNAAQRSHPWFDFALDKQSPEEYLINGTNYRLPNHRLPYNSHGWRYPFILYLDGIVDEGNIGAIIRSAYYLGVDAIALSKRSTAPIDAVALKASSGAAEAIPILTVSHPLSFLSRSTMHGWRVYAADAPPPPRDNFNVTPDYPGRALDPPNTSPLVSFTRPHTNAVLRDHEPLINHPVILMLGGEGGGFRTSVRDKANYLVGIRGTKGLEIGVDSLNVSVAAALIMLEMLRKPQIADKLPTWKGGKMERKPMEGKKKAERLDDRVWNDQMLF